MDPKVLDPNSVISGSFGKLYDKDGNWLTNVYKVDAAVDMTFDDVKRAGTRWKGKKLVALEGKGTFDGYLATTDLIKSIGQVANDGSSPYTTELVVEIDDPEVGSPYKVRLKEVKFDKLPLINYEVGTLVTQTMSFLFADYEMLDEITG